MKSATPDPPKKGTNRNWMRYLSYGIQLMASIGIGLYLGYLADKKLSMSFPLFIWVIPMVILIWMLVKLVRDFSKKKRDPQS